MYFLANTTAEFSHSLTWCNWNLELSSLELFAFFFYPRNGSQILMDRSVDFVLQGLLCPCTHYWGTTLCHRVKKWRVHLKVKALVFCIVHHAEFGVSWASERHEGISYRLVLKIRQNKSKKEKWPFEISLRILFFQPGFSGWIDLT